MTSTTTREREAELLAAIMADPDDHDDATRLVYADLLQHDGDPRGELIAVQCALAGLGVRWSSGPSSMEWFSNAFLGDPDICESTEMKRLLLREAALLKEHLKEWTKEVVALGKCRPTQCRMARGFLDHITWDITGDPKQVEKFLDAAPFATSIGLRGYAQSVGEATALLRSPGFAQMRALSFGVSLVNLGDGLRAITESPRLKGLRRIEGQIRNAVSQEMRQLSRASFFGQLESLDLGGSQLTQAIPPSLPPRLLELHLRDCKLGPQSAEALARCADLAGLQVLGLRDNALLSDGVNTLLKSKHLGPELRALNLRRNGLTTGNAQRLLSATEDNSLLPELRVLDISNIPRGAWDPAVLSKCAGLPSLFELHLERTLIDDDAIEAFVQSPLFSRLRVLDLRSNLVTEKGARAIAGSEGAKNLRLLDLTENPLRAAGKKVLAESPHLARARIAASPL